MRCIIRVSRFDTFCRRSATERSAAREAILVARRYRACRLRHLRRKVLTDPSISAFSTPQSRLGFGGSDTGYFGGMPARPCAVDARMQLHRRLGRC